ncbi:MAG: type II secretion system protein N [Burkholderiaceae bacterium]|nr:type II secretion system protein N [Burkholderiaceae bacterium]
MRRSALRWLGFVLSGVVAVALTVALFAPASFVAAFLGSATQGRVALVETAGTVWRGSGRIVLTDPAVVADATRRARVLPGVAVPGRVSWRVSVLPLFLGLVDASFRHDSMSAAVPINGSLIEVRVGRGSVSLPSVALGRLGSPWNTIKPAGALSMRWEGLTLKQGSFNGRAELELRDMSSALTPVSPVGSYRVAVVGAGQRADLRIETINGPLRLSGSGTFDRRGGVRFTAEARADEAERARLNAFLGLIGRRQGDHTVIKIGA